MKKFVYIVVEPVTRNNEYPKIIGVFQCKKDAESATYADSNTWRNIIKEELK